MQKADEAVLEKTIVLTNKGQFKEAIKGLRPLLKKQPASSLVCFVAAKFYYESGKYYSSSKYFKRLVLLKPDSEIASLGLFHSLCHLGNEILALKELDRFVSINKPVQYKITIIELKKSIKNSSNQKRNKIITEILLKVSKGQ